MSNELIHDVEESLKQEQMQAMWKEYGPYLIGGVVLAILLTAFISGWRSWQYKVNTANTDILVQAMSEDDVPAALDAVESTLRPGQKAIAYLSHAGILLNDNKPAEALAVLKEAAASDIPAPYSHLVQLQLVRLTWGLERENAEPQALLASLKPLIENRNNPWRHHARMQAALILGEGLGDYQTAQTHLAAVKRMAETDLPPSLIERAEALSSLYRLKQAGDEAGQQTSDAAEKPEG